MAIPMFSKKIKYTVAETVVLKIADWSVKQDRPDLCLVIFSLALGAGILSGEFKIPTRHVNFILEEYPSAFDENVSIEFSVILEEKK